MVNGYRSAHAKDPAGHDRASALPESIHFRCIPTSMAKATVLVDKTDRSLSSEV